MNKDEEMLGIGAVLSSYIYGDFTPANDNEISIGEQPNEFFFLKNMSKEDVHVYATKKNESQKRKVYVVFRGTTNKNHWQEAKITWPIIATSTENMKRNWWSNYFNDRLEYVSEKLDLLDEPKSNLEITFAGHSLGGTMSRVAATHFHDHAYQSKGFNFNPGNGLLSNPLLFKLASGFLKKHTEKLIDFAIPAGFREGAKLLTKHVSNDMLGTILNQTKFHNKINAQHNTYGDIVSILGGFQSDSTFYKNKQGDYWNFLSNHDMDKLRDQVLEDIGLTQLSIKEHPTDEPIPDVKIFRLNRSKIEIPQELQNYRIDPLQIRDIDNFQPMVTLSRLNYYNDLNKFNF